MQQESSSLCDAARDAALPQPESALVGTSAAFEATLRSIRRVAPTQAPVLILGETGTGKELLARAVHRFSRRATHPLVRVDCASLTPTLSESELFGHLRGAFTGAVNRRAGRIELAHRGTLFLDELGELPFELQAKLLRVLQEGEFEPLGTSQTVKVDIRVIAATHRPLAEEVKAGRFRADLYHRLAAFPIYVPPLRDRLDDLPALVAHLVATQAAQLDRPFRPVSTPIIDALKRHAWPGNVRELQNAVQRACILATGPALTIGDFGLLGLELIASPASPPTTPLTAAPQKPAALRPLREVEREHISAVLQQCGGAVEGRAGAAAILGLAPSTLRFRIRKLGITPVLSAVRRSNVVVFRERPPVQRFLDNPAL